MPTERKRIATAAPSTSTSLADDLLNGAEEIAAELGRPVRETYYRLERGHIPGVKIGRIWTSTRSGLRRHFGGTFAVIIIATIMVAFMVDMLTTAMAP
jgi:hypothetical protein